MSKYRLLFEKLEADFRTFENSQQARINARNAEIAGKQEELMQQLRVEEEKVRVTQEEKVQTVDNRIRQLRDEQAQCNLKLQKVKYEHPHQRKCPIVKTVSTNCAKRTRTGTWHLSATRRNKAVEAGV